MLKRGPASWTYIYTALGFALTIESTLVGMTPLGFPINVIVFFLLGGITVWLFIDNRWLHNVLIGFKARYEEKAR